MIVAIGDIHGKFKELRVGMLNILNETIKESTIVNFIQVGDFGLGFRDPLEDYNQLNTINNDLRDANSNLWVIRGNHDNPSFWNMTGYNFSNIHFVDDCIQIIEDKVCYFNGGAISINRKEKIQGVDYWWDEYSEFNTMLFNSVIGEYNNKIDLIFTHDVYLSLSPIDFLNAPVVAECAQKDSELVGDLLHQQVMMKMIYETIKSKYIPNTGTKWYHGHYHHSYTVWNKEDNMDIIGLDIFEFKEIF